MSGVPDGDPTTGVVVPTYRGPVAAGDIGWTLTHEHLFVRSPDLDPEYPHPEWERETAVDNAVAGLRALYDLGVRTIVDLTVPGLGRDVALVSAVARRVPINIVAATGWYADEVLPPFFKTHGPGRLVGGPDPLLDYFLRDLTVGIGESDVRAGVIKVVTDEPGFTPDIQRVLEAAAAAHVETGVLVNTHSNPRLRNGLDQVRFLRERGVATDHLVIGHSGDSDDLDYLLELVDTGATLGFDRFGMAHTGDDHQRIAMLVALVERGLERQIVLSHDSAYFSRVTPPSWRRVHTPEWTHDHLSRRVIPLLLERGITPRAIETMMVDNPRRLLTPVGSA